jgi:hypothetical protein
VSTSTSLWGCPSIVIPLKHTLRDDMPYPAGPSESSQQKMTGLSSGLSTVFQASYLPTPHCTLLAPTNSELPRGDGRVTSGLSAIFHKGKVVVRGRGGMFLWPLDSVLKASLYLCTQPRCWWMAAAPSLAVDPLHRRHPHLHLRCRHGRGLD